MANYTREKAKHGGMVGTIQMLTTSLYGYNSPLDSKFKTVIPAGYLKCNGAILKASDYPALAAVLGTGADCKFLKESKRDQVDSTRFMLPDLGSKVIVGGSGTGTYQFDFTDDGKYKVGIGVEITSNVGNEISFNYSGNFAVPAVDANGSSGLALLGNSKYIIAKATETFELNEENFQGHGHGGNQTVLNYTGPHTSAQSGNTKNSATDESGGDGANSSGQNILEEVAENNAPAAGAGHTHRITRPTTYSQNFKYGYSAFNVSPENIVTNVSVKTKGVDKLDEAVQPFMLVEYIIKF
jgi:hypothetical protein